jgi:hypothetical protein
MLWCDGGTALDGRAKRVSHTKTAVLLQGPIRLFAVCLRRTRAADCCILIARSRSRFRAVFPLDHRTGIVVSLGAPGTCAPAWLLPDAEPFRAWSNFEFIGEDGSINEVDLLVVGLHRIYLVEIKSAPAVVEADAGTWTWTRGGQARSMDNFDEKGVLIADHLLRRFDRNLRLWRMSVADYGTSLGPSSLVLGNPPVVKAHQRSEFVEAMVARMRAGYQEALVEQLATDLLEGRLRNP